MKIVNMKKISKGCISGMLALALAACGGGDDKSASGSITGVAATGDAISGGLVTLKCADGNTISTRTAVNGHYALQVDRLTLPCLAQVSFTDIHGSPYALHSYVSATGTTNITPLTELLTAVMLQHQPSDIFANISSNAFRMLSEGDPIAAWATVKTNLQSSQGILLPDDFDPVHDILQAKTDTQVGNAHDRLLDAAGLQLHVNFGNTSSVEMHITMSNGSSMQINNLHWGQLTTTDSFFTQNGGSASGFLSAQQFGQYYTINPVPEKTLAEAASSQQLAGLYTGSLEEGDSCSFRINTDGSILLYGSNGSADHLISATAFSAARAPLLNVWPFSETDGGWQGFLMVATEGTVRLRIYQQETQPYIQMCSATSGSSNPA